MGNAIENFVANKLFGGIIGQKKEKPASRPEAKSVSFESDYRYSSKEYVKELQAKRIRVNGKWNQFKQRLGFGETLTREEEQILLKEDLKAARRQAMEKLGGDFAPEREYRNSDW